MTARRPRRAATLSPRSRRCPRISTWRPGPAARRARRACRPGPWSVRLGRAPSAGRHARVRPVVGDAGRRRPGRVGPRAAGAGEPRRRRGVPAVHRRRAARRFPGPGRDPRHRRRSPGRRRRVRPCRGPDAVPARHLGALWHRRRRGRRPQPRRPGRRGCRSCPLPVRERARTADGDGWWDGVLAYNRSIDYARRVWTAADRYATALWPSRGPPGAAGPSTRPRAGPAGRRTPPTRCAGCSPSSCRWRPASAASARTVLRVADEADEEQAGVEVPAVVVPAMKLNPAPQDLDRRSADSAEASRMWEFAGITGVPFASIDR